MKDDSCQTRKTVSRETEENVYRYMFIYQNKVLDLYHKVDYNISNIIRVSLSKNGEDKMTSYTKKGVIL